MSSRFVSPGWEPEVTDTLRALGGQGTLGDIVVLTGLSRAEVERALDTLLGQDRAQVRVSESGDVIYHLGEKPLGPERGSPRGALPLPVPGPVDATRARQVGFDRKTLRLIRAREGVISLAELVEHTGLSLREAEREMERLADSYGGVFRSSWDGHVVCAFPELMVSAHGGLSAREPRPAWVRTEDPVRGSRGDRSREARRVGGSAAGLVAAVAAPWLFVDATPGLFLAVVGAAAVGLVVCGGALIRALEHHPLLRFRSPRSLRRYALGHVYETALAGKGVVSLDRTVRYLQARAGRRRVRRSAVETALRALAAEFDAPITEINGDLFFGFRNIKRQFLASHVQRAQMRLGRTAAGRTVFDTADTPESAAARELEAFDRQLTEGTANVHFA